MKSKLSKDDVLAELRKYGPALTGENDVTLKDVMVSNGWAASAAKHALAAMVKEGKLETLIVIGLGKVRTRVWRPKTLKSK